MNWDFDCGRMLLQISLYSKRNAIEWDEAVARCPMATFLHTRRYLAYHGDRFQDVSLLLKDEKQKILGLFPAAVDPTDEHRVVSHPGLTFGGLAHAGELYGERIIEALENLRRYYASQGFATLRYKAVPYIYHQAPSGDDLYGLFRLGAKRFRCDLSCAIDLRNRCRPSSRRRRCLKKALRLGVEVLEGDEFIDELWQVVEENLQRKLAGKPVHSRAEIRYLHSLFPENICFLIGRIRGQTVAGLTLFSTQSVMKAQYIASSEVGSDVCALDAVLQHAIEKAGREGHNYFDFGTSNRNDGQHLSASLYQFKSEFGAGGVAHEFYDINLES